jgi:hypothetical protein
MNNDVDQYARQKSLFGDEPATPHPKGFREELHAREKDNIPNPNRHPGQFAPKGGSNPLLKVVEHEHGWTASAMLKDGKEFRVEGKDRREAIGNAIRAGERMGVIFDPPAAEPKIGGLFGGSFDEKAHPRETKNHDGKQAGQFAPKHQAEEAPFVLQRPKKNLSVPSFGSNTNTKQSALFDVGKKNELPGQELLFNSDAGDLHNPKTMENKAKPVSRDSFMAQQGAASMGHSEPALHRLPGVKDNRKQELIARQAEKATEWQSKRDTASTQYDEAVQRGEVREPTRIERLATAAGGHPDNESTQAAIRLLSKTIAEEQVKNNENIGITMERHGVTIKGHPNYRLIRKQVMDNTDALREQAKPQPSPARQRAMDAQMTKSLSDEESIHRMAPGANKRQAFEKESGERQRESLAESNRFNENLITIAADDISKLRKQDVDRVLRSAPDERRGALESWIIKRRPELAQEVNEVSEEILQERAARLDAEEAKQAEQKPHPFEKSPRVKEDFDNAVKSLAKDPGYVNFTMYEQHAHPDFLPELLKHVRDNHLELFEKIVRMSSGKGSSGARKFALKKIEAPSEPAVKYSRAYEQFEEEAERYFRDYTLYDVDRYGMGGGIMKLILSMMAMHAMSSMINNQSQARQQRQKPSAAAPTTPSNQDFEKLHPRAQTESGNSKPGQFAKKPESQRQPSPPPQPRPVRPLTERPDKQAQLSQSPPTQQQQQPAPVTPKPWLAEPGSPKPDVTAYDLDPRRGTPEQKAAAMQRRMDRDSGAPQQPMQTPTDPNTARIAEIWHGKDSGQAEDFGAGAEDPPQIQPSKQTFDVWHSPKTSSSPTYSGAASAGLGDVFATDNKDYAAQYGTPGKYTATMQNPYQMNSGEFRSFDRGHDASVQKSAKFRKELESKGHDGIVVTHADGVKEHILFNKDSLQPQQSQPLKTEPAAPNPRKKTLGDGMTPNPAYNPQQITAKPIPGKPPRQRAEKAPAPEKPSLLDREVSDTGSNADIFENPAAKARREKAELDRITKFDVNDFAEPEGEEEFAGGEEFNVPAPTEDQFDTPEQLQKMQDYRARRPTSEDPQELAEWRKTKPETFESATKKWNAKRYRLNSKNKKAVQDDPEENIYQVAEQNEFLPEQFKDHIDEMQRHEQGEWERREKVKSNILRAWNTDRSTLKRMENRNQDHSNLLGADQLKGSVADSDLYEFLGSDEGEWAQNAWAMVREDTPPRPGAHDKDWLNSHAENFKRMQAMPEPDTEWYPEPEDGMPFSRKSLTKEIDRYFRQHLSRIRATKANSDSQSWTALDSWL